MIKRAGLAGALLVGILAVVACVSYLRNAAPVVPRLSAEEAARSGRPYVVKLHARWCAVCMVTKDEWARIQETYAGRVNLVVLDFTNEANTAASRAEAVRLGLERFFDEFSGATGAIVVLDGDTREVAAVLDGNRDFAEYQMAIDAALAKVPALARPTRISGASVPLCGLALARPAPGVLSANQPHCPRGS